jgi:hypothetical protein
MAAMAISGRQSYRTSRSVTELRATLEWNLIGKDSQHQLGEVRCTSETVVRIPSKIQCYLNGSPDNQKVVGRIVDNA